MLRRTLVAIFSILIVSSVALLGASSTAARGPATSSDGFVPIGAQIWHAHQFGPTHPMPAADMITDPIFAAQHMLSVETFQGRTVVDWVDLADANRWLALDTPVREADLVTEVVRIHQMVGVPSDVAALQASADAMPVELRAPFAALVGAVADAYADQLPIAANAKAAVTKDVGMDTRFLTIDERETMIQNAERIVAAFNAFRLVSVGLPLPDDIIFSDEEGLVVLMGDASHVHHRGGDILDPVLMVDLGGDDVYHTSAGGASPVNVAHDDSNGLAVSVLFDLDGNDQYLWNGLTAAVQGAGSIGGLGILVDVAGNDLYSSTMERTNRGPFTSYMDGGSQGFGEGGIGLQIDGQGDDVYYAAIKSSQGRSIWLFSQGWGGYGGLGISADAMGEDEWLAYGLGITRPGGCIAGNPARDICGFQGVYNDGSGFFGGVGIMLDTGLGNDIYRAYDNATTTDYYAQGFGAFGGVGIMFEDGGDDDYTAVEIAQLPFIVPLLNCAFGTGSLGGSGFFLEIAGNDRYYGASGSPRKGYVMNEGFGGIGGGYGMFIDVSGDDGHFMENLDKNGVPKPLNANGVAADGSDTFGRGVLLEHGNPLAINTNGDQGPNRFGNYLDLGGNDVYVGATPSRDGAGELGGIARWSGGLDANLPSDLILGAFL